MKIIAKIVLISLLGLALPALAADYQIDSRGAHASINFKIPHLGYSFLVGRFDKFEGTFSYEKGDPGATSVDVTIDTTSVNSNHAERDKHLRSEDFLEVDEYPEARFVGTRFESSDGMNGKLHGELTLRGVTKPVVLDVTMVGEGDDPWGGYRAGFEGKTTLTLKDFGIPMDLGPASTEVEMTVQVEGVRQ